MTLARESLPSQNDGLARLAGCLAALSGWRRLLLAFLLGALGSLAFAPLYLLPLLWPAFTGLCWLLDGAKRKRDAALIGWAFGTGHFLVGFYWVGIAFLVEAEKFAAFLPVAVLALAAGMALFPAGAVLATWMTRSKGAQRAVALAVFWLLCEWLRSWVFTGFPWNLMGNAWAFSPAALQLAAVTGVWGLSFLTVLAAALPSTLAPLKAEQTTWRRWRPSVIGLALLLVAWIGGALHLATAPSPGEDVVDGIQLRLVQPAIDQKLKWRPELHDSHVIRQMNLSQQDPGAAAVTHVIWAEAAVPSLLSENDGLKQHIAGMLKPSGLLLTGAPRRLVQDGETTLRNTLHALNDRGEIVASYDKVHLVPFGEYVPLRWLFGFAKVTQGRIDFTPGPGIETMTLPGLPAVGPLICYEVIFPGAVTEAGKRPEWLLSVTNDAWFGTSSGPYQHLASARLRAVEEGLPMVRVANGGISVVYDAYGRELARLGLNRSGIIDSPLPKPLAGETLFARIGNFTVLIIVLLGGALYFWLGRQNTA